MQPVVRPRHILAVAVFAVVAAAYGYFAAFDDHLADAQIDQAASVLKLHDSGLFPADPLFDQSGAWHGRNGTFLGIMGLLGRFTGLDDPLLPFRILAGPLAMIYLCGMYALLYQQCRSSSAATLVAVLSSAVIPTVGDSTWGMGPLSTVTPAGMCYALCPLLILMALRYIRTGHNLRLTMVFLATGLMGNIHPQTGINLGIILLAVLLASRKPSARSCLLATLCLAMLVAGLSPFLAAYIRSGALSQLACQPSVMDDIYSALHNRDLSILYPELLRPLPAWLVRVAALAIPIVVVLTQVRRAGAANLRYWVAFASAAVVVAFVFQGLMQIAGRAFHFAPPLLGFFEAADLVMIPLYALFAQALTSLFRLTRGRTRLVMRWACAVVLVVWLAPSENFLQARQMVVRAVGASLDEDQRPRGIQRILESSSRRAELLAAARWARFNTDNRAVFLSSSSEFRLFARRSIVAGQQDDNFLYAAQPIALPPWRQRFNEQRRCLSPAQHRADLWSLTHFIEDLLRQESFGPAGAWYVILPVSSLLESDSKDAVEITGSWGRYYRLYRVR